MITGILARLSRHADLFEAMIDKLGVRRKMYDLHDTPSVLRRANMRCRPAEVRTPVRRASIPRPQQNNRLNTAVTRPCSRVWSA